MQCSTYCSLYSSIRTEKFLPMIPLGLDLYLCKHNMSYKWRAISTKDFIWKQKTSNCDLSKTNYFPNMFYYFLKFNLKNWQYIAVFWIEIICNACRVFNFYFQVYKRLRDAVVLDWHISLLDKDQMSTCEVAYMKSDYSSDSERTKITEVEQQKSFLGQLLNVTTVKKYASHFQNPKPSGTFFKMSYIPRTRSFVIDSLESNQEYVFQMTCVDFVGHQHISSVLSFKTGNT